MQTVFHFVIEDTTRQFSTTTSATLKISDKISSPMENIYTHFSRRFTIEKIWSTKYRDEIFPKIFLSPLLFSIHDLYFFFTNDERNYFSSLRETAPLLPRSFIYFDFDKNQGFYRVALLSSENKNKISYLSVEWITTTTTILRASHVSFSSFRIELLRNASLGFFELHRQISDTLIIRHVGNRRLLT